MATITSVDTFSQAELSAARLNLMRGGYLFLGLGLALVKWPLLPAAQALPLYESVTLCHVAAGVGRTALSGSVATAVAVRVGLETLWLLFVALPKALAGDLDAAMQKTVFNCSLVVVILLVIPWRFVWRTYLRAAGDRWR